MALSELLREIIPAASIAVISNPKNPNAESNVHELLAAGRTAGVQVEVFAASNDSEIESALTRVVEWRAGALILADDPLFSGRRAKLVDLAARYAVPAIYGRREYPDAGGLISYGASTVDQYYRSGLYVGRILKGARPAELPFLQPTKFELAINLKTAKALNLEVPASLLARADEVIE